MTTYKLQHPGSCTGMFWRPDPRGNGGKQEGNADWPRNGSLLTGTLFEHNGEQWLEVTSWQQADSSKKIAAKGLFMPAEQGGPLLHKV